MNQQIDIADLIKTRFTVGQRVFHVVRGISNKVIRISPIRIERIRFEICISRTKGGAGQKKVELWYEDYQGTQFPEHDLIKSLDDLGEADRLPQV